MRIRKVEIENYRTLEKLTLHFPAYYTAICGKNDSGKSNVVRAIRTFVQEDESSYYMPTSEFSMQEDYPKWIDQEDGRHISISCYLEVNVNRDVGLYNLINKYLSLDSKEEDLEFEVGTVYTGDSSEQEVFFKQGEEIIHGIDAEEIISRIRSSRIIIFHNSTNSDRNDFYYFRRNLGRDLTSEYTEEFEDLNSELQSLMSVIANEKQEIISELLGRLEGEYQVNLSLPNLNLLGIPFNITLGDTEVDVSLDNWGSGTQNRTQILLNLLRARQISEAEESASKVTPVLFIEEPESFLHPSAQAEFGRILQALSEELKIQVVVTTHSPYMLSAEEPSSNILLARDRTDGMLRGTFQMNTSGDDWMEPFGLVLGVDDSLLEPWKNLLFTRSEKILLVEGKTDKEYLEMLKDDRHGQNKLAFDGEIFPYGSFGNLKNSVLLQFIKNRYDNMFITVDLDALDKVKKNLDSLGFEQGRSYCAVGLDEPGKRSIEGLVPDSIRSQVYADNVDLVHQLQSTSQDERRSAKNRLKGLTLDKFKEKAEFNEAYFGELYALAEQINAAFE